MKEKAIEHIIFDLDGTLVNSLSTTFEEFRKTILLFSKKLLSDDEILSLFGPSEIQIFRNLFGEEISKDAYSFYKKNFLSRLNEIKLFAGIKPVLKELKKREIELTIFTGRGKELTEEILKHLSVRELFSYILSSEEADKPKPAPDGILKLLNLTGKPSSESLYVGDSEGDIICGRAAGVKTALSIWRKGSHKTIKPKPDYILNKPEELLKILV